MKKYELQTQNSLPLVANEGQGEVYQSTMVINKMEVNLDIMLFRAGAAATGGVIGGWAGAKAGAAIGMGVGAFFFGAGAVPGAIIGGVVGGFVGSFTGNAVGAEAVDYYYGR